MVRAAVLVAVALMGCFDPHPQGGQPCESDLNCPRSLACIDRHCGGTSPAGDDGGLPMADADLTCSCGGSTLTCASGSTECDLGCSMVGVAHCARIVPSNGIDPSWADTLTTSITLPAGSITFNTDTGEITGALTRPAGTGIQADIGFVSHSYMGAPIGVFVFHGLAMNDASQVHARGTAAFALLLATSSRLRGVIEGSAACNGQQACAGPGGRAGRRKTETVLACGGAHGAAGPQSSDGGGGGGGNGTRGGDGGDAGNTQGGAAGANTCTTATIEPLLGGGGGGGGGPGDLPMPPAGGGGGGAIQITGLAALDVSATIAMNGAGGEGGPMSGDSAAGAGGGAGGSILLEAATITLSGSVLAANGGGGGGGGSGTTNISGVKGEDGRLTSTPAAGGAAGAATTGSGGPGGAGTTAAASGFAGGSTTNGGGAGGAVGRILVRAATPDVSGASSSPPVQQMAIITN